MHDKISDFIDLKIITFSGIALFVQCLDVSLFLQYAVPIAALGYTVTRWGILVYDRFKKK